MQTKEILIAGKFDDEAFSLLKSEPGFVVKNVPFDLTAVDLSTVNALAIRSRTKINDALLDRAPNLEVIVTATSGFDHIDYGEAVRRGITVMFAPGANVESAAQHTWAHVLALTNMIIKADGLMRSGEWTRQPLHGFLTGTELSGKTYGIVGLGRIGCRVAQFANCFNMRVIAYDPYCKEDQFEKVRARKVSYKEILAQSDFLSFHVPSTEETFHMVGQTEIELMKPGVFLINTCRGTVFSETEICKGLRNKKIAGLGLDVFEKEPLPQDSELFDFPNVILTPHTGANTFEAFEKSGAQTAQKIIAFLRNGISSDTLPPQETWYKKVPTA